MESNMIPTKRQPPKLMACMTKTSLENLRNRALFCLDTLDAKGIRRRKLPLYECLILELKESGYSESSDYLQDLIYDNLQLLAEDEIGIVVDLRKREDYLEHIGTGLQKAERQRDREEKKKECLELLDLAMYFAEQGKGILWLAEKLFLACIAVGSQYMLDGGRQKNVCKYYYGKFLLDKFAGADTDEAFGILTEVRDSAVGKDWPLQEKEIVEEDLYFSNVSIAQLETEPSKEPLETPIEETVFAAAATQLNRVLLGKVRAIRDKDPAKAERLSRLAERRALDAGDYDKVAEAILEIGICQLMMNNLNNALNTFERAFKIHLSSSNVEGLCDTKMHLAAVLQKLGDHAGAAILLTKMGALAMEHRLRLQLGRALHLLGELHLRSEKPELGTHHLQEAFACFMGFGFELKEPDTSDIPRKDGDMGVIYKTEKKIYEEEAEQSRLMMAISAGQEKMASYFDLIRQSANCSVAKMKVIEWKLSKVGWWVLRRRHDFLPCLCPLHNRTPLDVLKTHQQYKEDMENLARELSEGKSVLGRADTIDDIRKLRSSYRRPGDSIVNADNK